MQLHTRLLFAAARAFFDHSSTFLLFLLLVCLAASVACAHVSSNTTCMQHSMFCLEAFVLNVHPTLELLS